MKNLKLLSVMLSVILVLAFAFTTVFALQQGDNGEEVVSMQEALLELGYPAGPADGDYGAVTANAVTQFRNDHGLTEGSADEEMLTLLYQEQTAKAESENEYETMTYGSSGDAVVRLQEKLIHLQFMHDTADGYYGELTKHAVQRFQETFGLEGTGIADPKTQTVLDLANENILDAAEDTKGEALTLFDIPVTRYEDGKYFVEAKTISTDDMSKIWNLLCAVTDAYTNSDRIPEHDIITGIVLGSEDAKIVKPLHACIDLALNSGTDIPVEGVNGVTLVFHTDGTISSDSGMVTIADLDLDTGEVQNEREIADTATADLYQNYLFRNLLVTGNEDGTYTVEPNTVSDLTMMELRKVFTAFRWSYLQDPKEEKTEEQNPAQQTENTNPSGSNTDQNTTSNPVAVSNSASNPAPAPANTGYVNGTTAVTDSGNAVPETVNPAPAANPTPAVNPVPAVSPASTATQPATTESAVPAPAVAHTHSYQASVTQNATCTANGVRTYTCSCGDSYTETIPATGHNYVQTGSAPATCNAPGSITYTCTLCGSTETETIPATGEHVWQDVPHYYIDHYLPPQYVCNSCGAHFNTVDELLNYQLTVCGHSSYNVDFYMIDWTEDLGSNYVEGCYAMGGYTQCANCGAIK